MNKKSAKWYIIGFVSVSIIAVLCVFLFNNNGANKPTENTTPTDAVIDFTDTENISDDNKSKTVFEEIILDKKDEAEFHQTIMMQNGEVKIAKLTEFFPEDLYGIEIEDKDIENAGGVVAITNDEANQLAYIEYGFGKKVEGNIESNIDYFTDSLKRTEEIFNVKLAFMYVLTEDIMLNGGELHTVKSFDELTDKEIEQLNNGAQLMCTYGIDNTTLSATAYIIDGVFNFYFNMDYGLGY